VAAPAPVPAADAKSGQSSVHRLWRPFHRPGPRAALAPAGQPGARNAMTIWQDRVDDHGFPGRYATVRRFVAKLRGQRFREMASTCRTRLFVCAVPFWEVEALTSR
jgi:hypothetical protein